MGGVRRSDEFVRLDQVEMVYPSPLAGHSVITALHGVDLAVNRGELVVVDGHSGSGKTTLLGLAGLLWRPSGGRVFFMGRDVTDDSPGWRNRLRRRHLGFVFQEYHLFERMTAWESVALPLRIRGDSAGRCRELARELLDRLGLAGREFHRTEQLSGGERQRVALARAVAASPELIVADEPLSNADPASVKLISGLLEERRAAGAGVLVASHNRSILDSADRRLTLGERG